MMTTTGGKNNKLSNTVKAAAANAVAGLVARAAGNLVDSATKQSSRGWASNGMVPMGQPTSFNGYVAQASAGSGGKNRGSRKKRGKGPNTMRTTSVPGLTRMTLRTALGVTTNTGGSLATAAYSLGLVTNIGNGTLGGLFGTALTGPASAFRQMTVLRLKVVFLPTAGLSTTGNFSAAIDPDPSVGVPGGLTNIVHHPNMFLVSINESASFEYRPYTDQMREYKYTLASSGRPEESLSAGVLQVFSQNNCASGVVCGTLLLEMDVGFMGNA